MSTQTIDESKVEQFVFQAVGELGATLNAALVVIGDRLGLYKAMAGAGALTSGELAERTGTSERYVREWLNAQAAGGYVTYADSRYTLPPEHAVALADEDSPAFLPGAFQLMTAAVRDEPKITEAFRSGAGVGWHQHSHDLFEGCERFFRPGYRSNLVQSWIPALEGVEEKLRAGARVADVGCGHGASTIIMGEAYPDSDVRGFDYHVGSIEAARVAAPELTFEVASAQDFPGDGYDLVTTFDCLHDMGDPVSAAQHIRESMAQEGTWLIVEPFAGDRVEDNLNPVGRVYYAVSTLVCTPASLDQEVGLALGAQAGEARLRDVCVAAGFTRFRRAEIMCRAPQELERYARPATITRLNARRAETQRLAMTRMQSLAPAGTPPQAMNNAVQLRLDSAGVLGLGTLLWSQGWGVNKIFGATAPRVPTLDLSCEDYGLLHRLATNKQGPRVRLSAEAQATPAEVPMFNVVAELPGAVLPNEYVLLSAHLDSWHGATGATDNGTGTLTMLEAMRILKEAYPRPRRTILVGHWGGEEQGTIGSLAFGEDHPDVISGLQVAFNQDNGTWRVEILEAQGFLKAGGNLARWVAQLPAEMTDSVRLQVPGPQANTGSDHTSFVCRPAPAFRLQASYPEYRQYTWHTNRDTFDKIVFDDLKNNATMAAMLAYAASEDPERTSREVSTLPPFPGGQARAWPRCGQARRSFTQAGGQPR